VSRRLFTYTVSAALAIGLAWACGPRQLPKPAPSVRSLVVVLPEPDGDVQGRATVSNKAGTVELIEANASTQVTEDQQPSQPTLLAEADVRRLFGDALSDLPADAQHFTLYFLLDSDELTVESKDSLSLIQKTVKARPVPEVAIIGHSDTRGSSASNYTLGFKRASAVRAMLLVTGLDPALVDIASHGEAELLVPTPDDIHEPRNRRVEIVIK
jgi:outer membrane protein OmpA-like peptidoglycan-associated protein